MNDLIHFPLLYVSGACRLNSKNTKLLGKVTDRDRPGSEQPGAESLVQNSGYQSWSPHYPPKLPSPPPTGNMTHPDFPCYNPLSRVHAAQGPMRQQSAVSCRMGKWVLCTLRGCKLPSEAPSLLSCPLFSPAPQALSQYPPLHLSQNASLSPRTDRPKILIVQRR